ncbi:MAG: hypothetical protein ACXW0Q_02375 [Methylovulum sp.]
MMARFKNWILTVVNLLHTVKDENLHWQTLNQDRQAKLKHAQVLAEKALEAELTRQSVKLEHEIALLKTKSDAELSMFKTRCQQDLKDYKQYLDALDKLKRSIQTSYTHLPEAIAFTIHHHAKHLLNQMWETEDFEQKMRHEMQLITFMTTVHEEARKYLEGASTETVPEKTLRLIQKNNLFD